MFTLGEYGLMIDDKVRMRPYVEALRRAVKPGDVVIDLGAGPGLFALLACCFGARRVYAIEPDPVIDVARALAKANGLADRIEFIQDFSTKVELPERANVIIADLRGVLPLHDSHIATVADARRRLLTEDGILIPERDLLWAAIAGSPETYSAFVQAWDGELYGLDLSRARHLCINTWGKGSKIKPEDLLTEPRQWGELDYRTLSAPNVHAQLEWRALADGLAHGIIAWFDTVLYDGIGWSNAPGQRAQIYGSAFFPWPEAVSLVRGDRVTVALKANLIDNDYVWSWRTQIVAACGQERAAFQQSTFFGAIPSPDTLRKFSDAFVPALSEEGAVARYTLSLIDGQRTQGEIADLLCAQFPQQFSSRRAALDLVAALSQRYSR